MGRTCPRRLLRSSITHSKSIWDHHTTKPNYKRHRSWLPRTRPWYRFSHQRMGMVLGKNRRRQHQPLLGKNDGHPLARTSTRRRLQHQKPNLHQHQPQPHHHTTHQLHLPLQKIHTHHTHLQYKRPNKPNLHQCNNDNQKHILPPLRNLPLLAIPHTAQWRNKTSSNNRISQ